jgi:ribosome biogenesis GTPase A
MKRIPPARLQSHFGVPSFSGATDFLALVAQRRGKLRTGGAPDLEAAARAVLEGSFSL